MTRKDFELIARVLSQAAFDADVIDSGAESTPAEEMRQTIIAAFARELPYTNPLFDAGRFVRAAGSDRDEQ